MDAKGKKMSKSRGNVINPLDITDKYGTDAFRMGLIVGNTPGTSLALSEDKIKAYKHFANKIWNIARFVVENTDQKDAEKTKLNQEDKDTIEKFNSLIKEIRSNMDNSRFYISAEKIYHYTWHTFADIIIEKSKDRIKNEEDVDSIKFLLRHLLREQLKVLHPFMPFITEEIWSMFPENKGSLLMVEKWPIG